MTIKKYQEARDAVWALIIDLKINALPVKISDVFKALGIQLRTYSKNMDFINEANLIGIAEKSDGFTIYTGGKYTVFYDDTKPNKRIRFTLAHELGHVICKHLKDGMFSTRNTEPSEDDPEEETQANIFASRLLAPACVLHELKLFSAEKISKVCDISMQSAGFRLERLMLLEERNERFLKTRGHGCFYLSPLERQVHKQFGDFIDRKSL